MPIRNKIQSFFQSHRREAKLESWSHLKTRAGEARVKLNLSLPLLGHSVQGMPDAISEAYVAMSKDDSGIVRTNLNIMLEGMTVDIYHTDISRDAAVTVTAVSFDKFYLQAEGAADKRKLDLHFVAYVPANVKLRDWAWDTLHGAFFLEAIYSQSEMQFSEEAKEPETADDDEEEFEKSLEASPEEADEEDDLDTDEQTDIALVPEMVAAGTAVDVFNDPSGIPW